MSRVYLNGKRVTLTPQQAIGKGGEADVYRYGDSAFKLWKTPQHPDLQGLPEAQAAAQQRLELYQEKLPAFPPALPARVIAPQAWATDRTGHRILGYTMPLVEPAEPLYRYADRAFRAQGIDQARVQQILLDLADTLTALHRQGVVVGDLNDLNILVQADQAYLIDADSFQFGAFPCPVFTARFLDPRVCDPQAPALVPVRPFTPDTDWYAFAVLLMQVLLFVGPYGGVYRPRDPAQRLPEAARPLQRITLFHPEVRYPKPARPYQVLPDDLLHYLQGVFVHDRRGPFPRHLLESLRWISCPTCGQEHAHAVCPLCTPTVVVPAIPPTITRGRLTIAQLFTTAGQLVHVTCQDGHLRWLAYEQGAFRRETGALVLHGEPTPELTFGLAGERTLVAMQGQLVALLAGQPLFRVAVDQCGTRPTFAANARHVYWVEGGQLLRDGPAGAEHIGAVLAGQTRIWVGAQFGFGFYRAGALSVAFLFDADQRGINDTVALPRLQGQLLDARCSFAAEQCWFFTTTQEQGQTINRCVVIQCNGAVVATAQAVAGDGGRLATLTGKCAVEAGLFAATDAGLVRLECRQGAIVVAERFPETEPFVDAGCELLPYRDGLALVSRQSIRTLHIG
jgi:hypothetical protein